ncbi:DUF982 domain-containing protein [Mesorhizobium sp. CAU 1741]|uniref:DUF982 domain-containing protein n=1 Tax=Mesorhizobium sp. CAU 1741 TaxID=3140366 RepID=UPI00325BDA70
MENDWFDQPVRVFLDPRGNVAINVTSATQAAELLLTEWPTKPGAKHLAARKACLEVLEGIAEARRARLAFADAAEEAGVLAAPRPKSMASPEFRSPSWRKRKR